MTAFFVQKNTGSPITGKGMHDMIFSFCKDFDKSLNLTPSLFRTQQATIISQEKIGAEFGSVEKQQSITARVMNHTLEVHTNVYDKSQNQHENQNATKIYQQFFTTAKTSQVIKKVGFTMSDCIQDDNTLLPHVEVCLIFEKGYNSNFFQEMSTDTNVPQQQQKKRKLPIIIEDDDSSPPPKKQKTEDEIPDSILKIVNFQKYKERIAKREGKKTM